MTATMFQLYSRKEEKMNMVTHIVGGGLGVVALLFCVIVAAYNQNMWGIVSGIIYGFSVILLFTMSSIYHGLNNGLAKRVFRVLDHCTIFILIAGTYTPIMLTAFREQYPLDAWILFGVIWGLAVLGIVLNAVDLKRFKGVSIICYLGMGWAAVFRLNQLLAIMGLAFFLLILIGGILYTVGVLFYVWGRHKGYMHSVFHIFVVVASVLHSIAIAAFAMT
ncbi:MAG: hemolysin III family protein [Turicibacter sp.]|nr:hemolysin III family protein [Turicibacter sp.]